MSDFDDNRFKQLQLNVNFNIIPNTRLSRFQHHFSGYKTGLVGSEPGKFVMTPAYGRNADKIFRFATRNDDVWILTFPKCGTTWTSELLWLLLNNCDTETAKKTSLFSRAPFLDMPYLDTENEVEPDASQILKNAEKMTSPRVIKSHLPFNLLPPKLLDTCKVVYVARNPKDVIVSFYFHHKLFKFHGYTGDVEEFAQYFMDDQVLYSPYFPHVLDAWSKRNHPNMHFMFFEDMKKDLRGEIEKVAAFLNKSPTNEQLENITQHLRFDNFEKNEAVNNEVGKTIGFMNEDGKFIRKGKTGDWKNLFTPEMNTRLDNWIADNLVGTDLSFVTELEHQD